MRSLSGRAALQATWIRQLRERAPAGPRLSVLFKKSRFCFGVDPGPVNDNTIDLAPNVDVDQVRLIKADLKDPRGDFAPVRLIFSRVSGTTEVSEIVEAWVRVSHNDRWTDEKVNLPTIMSREGIHFVNSHTMEQVICEHAYLKDFLTSRPGCHQRQQQLCSRRCRCKGYRVRAIIAALQL